MEEAQVDAEEEKSVKPKEEGGEDEERIRESGAGAGHADDDSAPEADGAEPEPSERETESDPRDPVRAESRAVRSFPASSQCSSSFPSLSPSPSPSPSPSLSPSPSSEPERSNSLVHPLGQHVDDSDQGEQELQQAGQDVLEGRVERKEELALALAGKEHEQGTVQPTDHAQPGLKLNTESRESSQESGARSVTVIPRLRAMSPVRIEFGVQSRPQIKSSKLFKN
ncbi:hypothetical protein NLJ89_g9149 [Agrocybe chaxingu]|uniref:Uncharacterized protein n=1 Tax=Agrocybe chaxingu TaxID=84603 RepID=A0A9W8JWB3_9AGAR|nr:hypothetical protein NLJ89_g9149 [Agrocybe chaxingu]